MLKQKLYASLIQSQHSLPALAFVLTFAIVAGNVVALKHNFVYAASLLPASQVSSITNSTATSEHIADGSESSDSTPSATSAGTITDSSTIHMTAQPATIRATSNPLPVAAHTPAPAPASSWPYPLHSGIRTTWFYAGEPASADNDYIQNVSSAWQEDWQTYFGGSDDPSSRCGYAPCGFTPRENPFYFALPFSDFTNTGPVSNLSMVYWYDSGSRALLNADKSILKNRWIQISLGTHTVYAQWEDVGPFKEHDGSYVFGNAAPQSTRAGLDVSPAVRDYLKMGDVGNTSWRFVTDAEVPAGPWKNIVTTSDPDWN